MDLRSASNNTLLRFEQLNRVYELILISIDGISTWVRQDKPTKPKDGKPFAYPYIFTSVNNSLLMYRFLQKAVGVATSQSKWLRIQYVKLSS